MADDWVIERDEYAAAGVPAYLVIDLRGDTPRLALFDRLIGGRYADPVGDGRCVDLHIAGRTIPLDVDDLVDRRSGPSRSGPAPNRSGQSE